LGGAQAQRVVSDPEDRGARGEAVAAALREIGVELTDEGRAWARSVLRRPTEAQMAESQRYLEALETGHVPDPA
jgi:hypothetical protein